MNSIFGRLMRGSIEDESRLVSAGIDLKVMVKAGICPALLLSGIQAIPPAKLSAAGINPNELTDDNLNALGLNPVKLHSKGPLVMF